MRTRLRRSLAHSHETRFTRLNRRACSQAIISLQRVTWYLSRLCSSSVQLLLCSQTTRNLSFFIEVLCLKPWFSWVHSTVGSHQVFIKPAVSLAVYLRFLKLFTASIISFFSFCLFCKTSC